MIDAKLSCKDLSVRYGAKLALAPTSLDVPARKVTALIGPSGCGKTTLLRSLNRMNDLVPDCRVSGRVLLDGADIYAEDVDPVDVRRRIGMVFQKSNPLPKSIFENVAYGLRIAGVSKAEEVRARVQHALSQAALLEEVQGRLHESALGLSGGQQQRLCIARALAVAPEVLLMDEPASALDPISTSHVEDLIRVLARQYTVVIVTHNMQQAVRVADYTAFFYLGELVEFDETKKIFNGAAREKTREYVAGKFG